MTPQPLGSEPAKEEITNNLVIQSREYQNRNTYEELPEENVEVKAEKKVKQMKLTKNFV
jgi:hypothetical protein